MFLSAVLGYILGVWRDRSSERYKRRVEAAVELRTKTMQAVRFFPFIINDVRVYAGDLIVPLSLQKLDEHLRLAQDQNEKLHRELAAAYGYYHASKLWLPSELREAFEALADGVNGRSGRLKSEVHHQLSLDNERHKEEWRERLIEKSNELDRWVRTDLPVLQGAFEAEVEKAAGIIPLWRRVLFG